MSWVRIFCLFWGQFWYSAWSWVRIFYFWGVNSGVVHGCGIESFTFGVNGAVVHGLGFEYFTFGVNGHVVQWCNCNDPPKDKDSTTTMYYTTIHQKSQRFEPKTMNVLHFITSRIPPPLRP
jgi:hypothetical protein